MDDDDRRPDVNGRDRLATAAGAAPAPGKGEPRHNWLRRIIAKGPSARRRLGEAIAALLGTALVALAAIGGLVIWHLVRRGRIMRERLAPPRIVRMPGPPDVTGDLHDEDGEVPTS
jgi:hypothetical protein